MWKWFPPLIVFACVSITVCSSVLSDMLCASFSLIGWFTLCMCNVLQVLFDKLCLHEQCENRKLPKTLSKQQQSTSEAAVRLLQTHRGVIPCPSSYWSSSSVCTRSSNTNSQASLLLCRVRLVHIIYWLQVHLPTYSADAPKKWPPKRCKQGNMKIDFSCYLIKNPFCSCPLCCHAVVAAPTFTSSAQDHTWVPTGQTLSRFKT